MLASLAHVIVRRRRLVIGLWIGLTLFGAFSASQVSKRWFQTFSIPGYSAYEANKRTLERFGTGQQAPLVAVFHTKGDITKVAGLETAVTAAAAIDKGSRTSSFWSTGSGAYVSKDGHTAFAEIMTHAGRSVIVSGSTVAVGLVSLVVLPLPFIRSIGLGGLLIPAVSVLAAITLLPALLSTLGTRINSVRLLPKRFV